MAELLTRLLEELAQLLRLGRPHTAVGATPAPPSRSPSPPAAPPSPRFLPRRLNIRHYPYQPVQSRLLVIQRFLVEVGLALLEKVKRDEVTALGADVRHPGVGRTLRGRVIEVG